MGGWFGVALAEETVDVATTGTTAIDDGLSSASSSNEILMSPITSPLSPVEYVIRRSPRTGLIE